MAGAAQRDRPRRDASGAPSSSWSTVRAWPLRRDAGLGPFARGRGAPHQGRRCGRARPGRHGIRVACCPQGGTDMKIYGTVRAAALLIATLSAATGFAAGPDVIVGFIPQADEFDRKTSPSGQTLVGITAATNSCNMG